MHPQRRTKFHLAKFVCHSGCSQIRGILDPAVVQTREVRDRTDSVQREDRQVSGHQQQTAKQTIEAIRDCQP